jgi:hypothetical protein
MTQLTASHTKRKKIHHSSQWHLAWILLVLHGVVDKVHHALNYTRQAFQEAASLQVGNHISTREIGFLLLVKASLQKSAHKQFSEFHIHCKFSGSMLFYLRHTCQVLFLRTTLM